MYIINMRFYQSLVIVVRYLSPFWRVGTAAKNTEYTMCVWSKAHIFSMYVVPIHQIALRLRNVVKCLKERQLSSGQIWILPVEQSAVVPSGRRVGGQRNILGQWCKAHIAPGKVWQNSTLPMTTLRDGMEYRRVVETIYTGDMKCWNVHFSQGW